MELTLEELVERKRIWNDPDFADHFIGLDFIIYAVRSGERLATVLGLLAHRPYTQVINLRTGDERVSILTAAESEPALLIVEGADERAGVNEMVGRFGPRIFTLAFRVRRLDELTGRLRMRGAPLLTETIQERHGVRYISTSQSPVTLDTYMYVERSSTDRTYDFFPNAEMTEVESEILDALKKRKRLKAYRLMKGLDHIAYRVHGADITAVGEEIMRFTPYQYTEAFEIEEHDAKTVVFRFGDHAPAIVASYGRSGESLVEKYVDHYGPRVHHMAYEVTDISAVVTLQKKRSMTFTTDDLIGTKDEGIVQIFSTPAETTDEITEYVQRFDGFTGFFSPHNVGNLMTSTRAYQ